MSTSTLPKHSPPLHFSNSGKTCLIYLCPHAHTDRSTQTHQNINNDFLTLTRLLKLLYKIFLLFWTFISVHFVWQMCVFSIIFEVILKAEVKLDTQSCPTLWDSVDCSSSGSSVHGILQAKILEWVAISFSWGFSWSRDLTHVSSITGRFFINWATRESILKLL